MDTNQAYCVDCPWTGEKGPLSVVQAEARDHRKETKHHTGVW